MPEIAPGNAQERTGTKNSSSFLSAHDRRAERPTWRSFFAALLKHDYKVAGWLIFGGNPETGRSNLSRIIESKHQRHADWEWIDLILEAAGGESPEGRERAEAEFVRFVCDRYGFEVPTRVPTGEREREELASLKEKLNDVLSAIPQIVGAIEHVEKSLEKKR